MSDFFPFCAERVLEDDRDRALKLENVADFAPIAAEDSTARGRHARRC